MRKVIAFVLSLTLPSAAVGVPVVHAHLDDHATDHHLGRVVHAHWADHAASHDSSGSLVLESSDLDRAVFLTVFVVVATSSLPTIALAEDAFTLTVPEERHPHFSVAIAHGHDPPLVGVASCRAPPAFLS